MGAFFGDKEGNVYAFDAATGAELWKRKADDQEFIRVTGSPKYHDGRLYVPVTTTEEALPTAECCKSQGALVALEASSGKQIWKTYTIKQRPRRIGKTRTGKAVWGPAGVGIWGTPTLDLKKGMIYVGTANSTSPPEAETSDSLLGLDLKTGKIRWHKKFTLGDIWNKSCKFEDFDPALCPNPGAADEDFGASPVLVELDGGKRVLLGPQKSAFNAVDPANGDILWRWPGANTHWGVTVTGDAAYVPRSTGGLDVFDLRTGRKLWQSPPASCEGRKACDPGESAAITGIPGVVFSGTLDGRLRAVSSQDGKPLWEFDTVKEYSAVDGIPAHGGTIDGAGPSVVGGMVFACSGYGKPLPGNVLLAFSVEGK
jgi:polyvinyl alcohol dehydrogenase (cytochrome)